MKCQPQFRTDPVSNAWWPFKETTEGGFASPAEKAWQRQGVGVGRAYRTLPETRGYQEAPETERGKARFFPGAAEQASPFDNLIPDMRLWCK